MHRSATLRAAALAVTAAALGTVFGPPLAAGAAEKLQEVFVANTPSDPVPTAEVGEPVGFTARLDWNAANIHFGGPIYTVPAGKVLVVEHVSFTDEGSTLDITGVTFTTSLGDDGRQIYLPLHAVGADHQVASEAVTAYAGPSSDVWATAYVSDPSPFGSFFLSVSGRLVDA